VKSEDFSKIAPQYARFRPLYPEALFAYLASLAPARLLAWDCATGNGQAAIGLAQYFERVHATDVSDQQIANAMPMANVTYHVAPAESSTLDAGTVDLITVGQALHWLPFDAFFAEARRVLRPSGVLAAWTYHLPMITPEVDAVVSDHYWNIVRPYFGPEIQYVDEKYATLPFPGEDIETPEFATNASWMLDDLVGFMRTWSGRQRFMEAHGRDPIDDVLSPLADAWGDADQPLEIAWKIYVRATRLGTA
jgi:ubiquinone/menaquinone biosynthesis C-methylase UbiE